MTQKGKRDLSLRLQGFNIGILTAALIGVACFGAHYLYTAAIAIVGFGLAKIGEPRP